MKTVPLHGKKAAGRVTRVDDSDYDFVMHYRWRVTEEMRTGRTRGPYARTTVYRSDGTKTTIQMHTLLTGWPLVDHQDHDGLNNQRSNLRPATFTENSQNARPALGASSPYKGVTWNRQHRKWFVRITAPGSGRIFLGLYVDEVAAALAYDKAARDLYKEFAVLNFPDRATG